MPFIIPKLGDGDDEQFVEAPSEAIPTEAVETFEGVDCLELPLPGGGIGLNCCIVEAVAVAAIVGGGVGAVGDARLSCPRFNVARPLNAAAAGSFDASGGDGDCVIVPPGTGVVDGV
uniref:Uncharacterized protein n=1 Tax=Panagrolaimus sp. ES5 TaxID=591445 RepID=A0AC34GW22_9BILA